MVSGDAAIGVLSLDSIQTDAFTQAQADLLAIFANQASIAVINVLLYDQAQVTAVAGERSRLARDMHDAVTQTIFSASLIAATLPAPLPELSPAAQADLELLQTLVKITFYRVAQEALNNAAKHAKAGCVTIRYSTRGPSGDPSGGPAGGPSGPLLGDAGVPGSVRLAVVDDGRGFAAESMKQSGLGLRSCASARSLSVHS